MQGRGEGSCAESLRSAAWKRRVVTGPPEMLSCNSDSGVNTVAMCGGKWDLAPRRLNFQVWLALPDARNRRKGGAISQFAPHVGCRQACLRGVRGANCGFAPRTGRTLTWKTNFCGANCHFAPHPV